MVVEVVVVAIVVDDAVEETIVVADELLLVLLLLVSVEFNIARTSNFDDDEPTAVVEFASFGGGPSFAPIGILRLLVENSNGFADTLLVDDVLNDDPNVGLRRNDVSMIESSAVVVMVVVVVVVVVLDGDVDAVDDETVVTVVDADIEVLVTVVVVPEDNGEELVAVVVVEEFSPPNARLLPPN